LEIKINKEIRDYSESIFFGLSLRQFVCALLCVAAAVGCYFGLKPYLGDDVTSWVCILGAAPFAALGFLRYNGMPAEQFVAAWLKSELLLPRSLAFQSLAERQMKKRNLPKKVKSLNEEIA